MSRLGPHVLNPTTPALEWARRAPIVATVDNLEPLRVAQPDAVRLFRRYFPNQSLTARASDVAGAILRALDGYNHPRLYVQAFVGIPGPQIGAYLPLLRETTAILHAHGYKVAGPSWYSGDYEAEHVQTLRQDGWASLDAWCVQAYWATAGLTPWNALRYRQFWRPGDPPVIVGECGRDRVRDGPGGTYLGQPGWKNQGVNGSDYVAELKAYDAELARDAYVLGGVVYTAGPTPDWAGFSTDDLDTSGFVSVVSAPVQPPAPAGETVMQKVLQVWQYGQPSAAETGLADAITLAKRTGFTALSVKALDGSDWMHRFNPVADALNSVDQAREQAETCHAAGLRYYVWTNPLTTDAIDVQTSLTGQLANVVDGVFLDVEPYPQFWGANRPVGLARSFMERIRAIAPSAWIALQPDPRPTHLAEIRVEEWLPFVDVLAGQHYWSDFSSSPDVELALAKSLGTQYGRPVWPTVPGNAPAGTLPLAALSGFPGLVCWRLGTASLEVLTALGGIAEPVTVPEPVPAEYRQWGATWPEVVATLKGVADDALARLRRIKAYTDEQAASL